MHLSEGRVWTSRQGDDCDLFRLFPRLFQDPEFALEGPSLLLLVERHPRPQATGASLRRRGRKGERCPQPGRRRYRPLLHPTAPSRTGTTATTRGIPVPMRRWPWLRRPERSPSPPHTRRRPTLARVASAVRTDPRSARLRTPRVTASRCGPVPAPPSRATGNSSTTSLVPRGLLQNMQVWYMACQRSSPCRSKNASVPAGRRRLSAMAAISSASFHACSRIQSSPSRARRSCSS